MSLAHQQKMPKPRKPACFPALNMPTVPYAYITKSINRASTLPTVICITDKFPSANARFRRLHTFPRANRKRHIKCRLFFKEELADSSASDFYESRNVFGHAAIKIFRTEAFHESLQFTFKQLASPGRIFLRYRAAEHRRFDQIMKYGTTVAQLSFKVIRHAFPLNIDF